jgi:hypothetical protein
MSTPDEAVREPPRPFVILAGPTAPSHHHRMLAARTTSEYAVPNLGTASARRERAELGG